METGVVDGREEAVEPAVVWLPVVESWEVVRELEVEVGETVEVD